MGLVCLFPFLLLLPNLPYFETHIIGATGSDAAKHVWGQWWVHRSIVLFGTIPFELDINNFPEGGPFFCLDTANAILSLPLRLVFHPVLSFNVLILLHMFASGLSAWYFCLQLTKDDKSAVVAGVAFACAPFALAHGLSSGVSEGIFLFPTPLILLCMLRMATRSSWKYPVLGAFLLIIQGLGSWHYAILAGIFTFTCGAIVLLSKKRFPVWIIEQGLQPGLMKRVLLFVVILLPMIGGLFLQVQDTVEGDEAVYQRGLSLFPDGIPQPELIEKQLLDIKFTDKSNIPWPAENVLSFFDPIYPTSEALHVDRQSIDILIATGYTGLTWIFLGLYGDKKGRFFVLLAALFHALAMGPRVFWGPQLEAGGFRNPIYTLFYLIFPLFHETRHVNERYAMGTALCIGIAAAFGVQKLRKKWPSAHLFAIGIFMVETISLSPSPWPVPHSYAGVHATSKELSNVSGGIIDMPRQEQGSRTFVGDILVQQMYHQNPIPYSMDEKPNPRPVVVKHQHLNPAYLASEVVADNFYYRYLLGLVRGGDDLKTCHGIQELKEMGFVAFVFREDAIEEEYLDVTRLALKRCLTPGTRTNSRQIFWISEIESPL